MLIVGRQSIYDVQVFLFREHIQLSDSFFRHNTRLYHDITFVVNDSIQFLGR